MSIVEKLFGNLPDGWIIARLSSYLKNEKNSIKAGPFGSHLTNTDMQGSDIKVYNQRTVLDNDFINGDYYISEEKFEELKGFIVEPNDMLVTTRGTIGKCVIVPENVEVGILHPCLIKMKISEQKINPNYLQYIFNNTNIVKEQVQFLSNSTTIDVIYTQTLKDINFTLPVNIVDQNKIVSYLDKKVTEIDLLISKKELKVNLLQQQRQSIITEAATKGLNPNVKMKDSGVEWIGEIPEHWEKKRIKHLVNRMHRQAKPHHEVVTAFRDGQVTLRKNRREDGFTFSIKEIGYQGINKGDLVVHQMDAFAGAIGISDSEGKASPVYTVCTAKNEKEIHLPYLCEVIRVMSKSGYIESLAKGIRERSTDFRWSDMGPLLCLLPPKTEQIEITGYIENKSKNIKILVSELRTNIEKLKEYRQSLIYETVTGKIDVRDMELD